MFGFSIKTRQSVGDYSPKTSDSARSIETPISTSSPRTEVGEIDTRAPFQSVKAAVSLFGEALASPTSNNLVSKKPKTAEERVLEKETQLHLALKELHKFKDQLKLAEDTKSQAGRDLEKARRTLQDLTTKLETASESKQAAIAATEAAKACAKELEESAKSGTIKSQLDNNNNDSWKHDIDLERENYKTSAGELIAAKQELTNIRQDFDAALETKLAAFQEAADAQHATKVNKKKLEELAKEFDTVRETLSQVRLATAAAREEQAKSVEEREAILRSHRIAMGEVESQIGVLKKEESELEIYGNLEEKLEETTEGISVLQEQLKNVRESDIISLKSVTSELEEAKNALKSVLSEENRIKNSIESLKAELEEVRRELKELKERDSESETQIEKLRIEVEKGKAELAAGEEEEREARRDLDDMAAMVEQLKSETEKARLEAEETKRGVGELEREAEAAREEILSNSEKLRVCLVEAEAAKAAAAAASDQIRDIDATDSESKEKIKLSIGEFEVLSKKAEEIESLAAEKVAAGMVEVEEREASEMEAIKRLEASWKEIEHIKAATEDALRKAEMAEAAKRAVEGELQKWRRQEDADTGVGGEGISR